MSQESEEVYRRSADAWTRGALHDWLSDVTPEWEWRTSGVFPGLQPVYRGRDGARDLWRDMRGPWEEFSVDIERLVDLGDMLLALITFCVRGRDGIETRRRWAHVVTYRNGMPAVTENYESWADALEAVGLSEQDAHADS